MLLKHDNQICPLVLKKKTKTNIHFYVNDECYHF